MVRSFGHLGASSSPATLHLGELILTILFKVNTICRCSHSF